MIRRIGACFSFALLAVSTASAQEQKQAAQPGAQPTAHESALEVRVKTLEAELKAMRSPENSNKPNSEEIEKVRKEVIAAGKEMDDKAEKFFAVLRKLCELEGKPFPPTVGGMPPMMGREAPEAPWGGGFGREPGFGGMGGYPNEGERRGFGGERGMYTGYRGREEEFGNRINPGMVPQAALIEIGELKREMAEMKAMIHELREEIKKDRN